MKKIYIAMRDGNLLYKCESKRELAECLEREYSDSFEYSESKDDFIIYDNLLQIDEFTMSNGYLIAVNDMAIDEYCEQVGLEAEELIQIYRL